MPIHAPSSRRSSRFALMAIGFFGYAGSGMARQDVEPLPVLCSPTEVKGVSIPAIDAGSSAYAVVQSGFLQVDPDAIAAFDAAIASVAMEVAEPLTYAVELFEGIGYEATFDPNLGHLKWFEPDLSGAGTPPPDGFIIRGRIDDGSVTGHIVLLSSPRSVSANIAIDGEAEYRIRPIPDDPTGLHAVHETQSLGGFACEVSADHGEGGAAGSADSKDSEGGVAGTGCDGGSVIDVIVLFTTAAGEEAEGRSLNIVDEIAIALEETDVVYENSELEPMRLRPVFVGEIGEAEFDDSQFASMLAARDALEEPWDGPADAVHAFRDAIRADLVSILTIDIPPNSGVAGLLANPSPAFEFIGVSVVAWDSANGLSRGLAHETGHNLGCAHNWHQICGTGSADCTDPCDTCSTGGAFDDSYGYHFRIPPGTVCYGTVMSYDGTATYHYSNPDADFVVGGHSAPSGLADCADNAGTILQTRDDVAMFRQTKNTAGTTAAATIDTFEEVQANEDSESPAISGNGQDILYATEATNLYGSSSFKQVARFNRESGTIHLVTAAIASSSPANNNSWNPAVSANRQWFGCTSQATNLISSGPSGQHVYAIPRKLQLAISPQPAQIDVNSSEQSSNGSSDNLAFSYDGEQGVFDSSGTNLDALVADTNGFRDVFARDRDVDAAGSDTDHTSRLSINFHVAPSDNNYQANGDSFKPVIDSTGRFAAFETDSTNTSGTDGDTNGKRDIVLVDRDVDGNDVFDEVNTSGQTDKVRIIRVSRASNHPTSGPNNHSYAPSLGGPLDANGDVDLVYITYYSLATNIISGITDSNAAADVFLFVYDPDTQTGTTYLVSHASGSGSTANGGSLNPSISADCRWIVIESAATNLMSSSTPSGRHIFLVEISNLGDIEVVEAISVDSSEDFGNGASYSPVISAHGRFIAAKTDATDLFASDSNGDSDIFYRDRGPLLGDLNGDGEVTSLDLDILLQNMDYTCSGADLNFDGVVDEDDQTILEAACTDCP